MADLKTSRYSGYFQSLINSGRLIEAYNGKADRFTAQMRLIRERHGERATAVIVGVGSDANSAVDDLCDKIETAKYAGTLLDLA
jgi:hypothetical protein